MSKSKSPRATFIETITLKKLAAYAWNTNEQASNHDPEHAKELKLLQKENRELEIRIGVLERQMERIGAPQYRRVA